MIVKQADAREMAEAFAQVFVVWPHDPDPAVHLQKRLHSVQHLRATWFVLIDEGQVVASLGAYPFRIFGPDGDRPARVFGAVFTPETHRGKGHAARLLTGVMDHYAAGGTQDFLLYSDIDPAYYARFGFQVLPSYEWEWEVPAGETGDLIVVPARPLDAELGFRYGLRRQTEDARWAQEKQNQELRLARCAKSGIWLLSRQDHGTYTLLETNLSQNSQDWATFAAWVNSDARAAGCGRVRGWWVNPAAEPRPSGVNARGEEILMWMSRRAADPWSGDIARHGFRALLSEHV